MSRYVSLNIYVDKQVYEQLESLMNSDIVDEDGNVRFMVHKGSKQIFYRQIIELGMNEMYKKLNEEKKKLENEDNSKAKGNSKKKNPQ